MKRIYKKHHDILALIYNPGDECIEWPGCKNQKGYGLVQLTKPKRCRTSAHRLAYAISKGISVHQIKRCVLHTCDNPGCINPKHLWLGTHQDNMLDRDRKGRCRSRGVRKLSLTQCSDIRQQEKEGRRQLALARMFNVSLSTISKVIRGVY